MDKKDRHRSVGIETLPEVPAFGSPGNSLFATTQNGDSISPSMTKNDRLEGLMFIMRQTKEMVTMTAKDAQNTRIISQASDNEGTVSLSRLCVTRYNR